MRKACSILTTCILFTNVNIINFITSVQNPYQFKAGAIYHYTNEEKNEMQQESKWCHEYYNFSTVNQYHKFIVAVQDQFQQPANSNEQIQFDYLFDNHRAPRVWYNFAALNQQLTTKRLSDQVTLQINWNNLFNQVHLHPAEIKKADELLVRFYNIIAKLYGTDNVLRLVQNVNIDNNISYYGKTIYYPNKIATAFRFQTDFINQAVINNEFFANSWSTNNKIINCLHQYGQALVYYVMNSQEDRTQFNTESIISTKQLTKNTLNLPVSPFHDVTQDLINFIDKYRPISTNKKPVQKMLFELLVVNSRYGRIGWITDNVNSRDEFFNEAFAKWIATKACDRHRDWEILNHYFMETFRKNFQLL